MAYTIQVKDELNDHGEWEWHWRIIDDAGVEVGHGYQGFSTREDAQSSAERRVYNLERQDKSQWTDV